MTQQFDDRKHNEPSPLIACSLSGYLDALTTTVMEQDFGIVAPDVASHLVDIQTRGTVMGGLLPVSPVTSARVRDLPAALKFSLSENYFSGREEALVDFRRQMGDAFLYIQGIFPGHPERVFTQLDPELLPIYSENLDQLGSGSYAAAAELADELDSPQSTLWETMSEQFSLWRSVLRRVREQIA